MTPEQKAALETLIGRALTAPEITAIDGHLPAGNAAAIAAVLGLGPPRIVPRPVSTQGVRGALGDVEGERFVRALLALQEAAKTDAVPAWLTAVLTSMQRPADTHALTLGTLGAALGMLGTDKGIDVGDPTTRAMLDLLAAGQQAGGPAVADACAALKALAVRRDPIDHLDVSRALEGAA